MFDRLTTGDHPSGFASISATHYSPASLGGLLVIPLRNYSYWRPEKDLHYSPTQHASVDMLMGYDYI